MEIITKAVTDSDRQRCIEIENGATPGLHYINDTWAEFTSPENGQLIGAYADGLLAGIGRITKLYGGYGWLEALRVHPDFQGMGLGSAIYKRYLSLMPELELKALGMYTNMDNIASKSLAEKYGLSVQGHYIEYKKEISGAYSGDDLIKPLTPEEAEGILSPLYKNMPGFIVLNRTFYPVNEGLGKAMAASGYVYGDQRGNVLIAGARFQPEKSLHMGFFHGDVERIVEFSCFLAHKRGSKFITHMCPAENSYVPVKDYGFTAFDPPYITLWSGLSL